METASICESLLNLSHPWAHIVLCSERTFEKLFSVLPGRGYGIAARIIRGDFCRTSLDFFRELTTALDYPSYFGNSWDAFNDCINDLEWIPAQHYVIGISRSDRLLAEDEIRLATFANILRDAAETWPTYDPHRVWTETWVAAKDGAVTWRQRPVASFHVAFHCEPNDETVTRDRFQRAGLSLVPLHIPPEFAAQ